MLRRKRHNNSLQKRRQTEKAQLEVDESIEEIDSLQKEIVTLENEHLATLDELNNHWLDIADKVTTIAVSPYKKDIDPLLFGVAWIPHFLTRNTAGELVSLVAYQ